MEWLLGLFVITSVWALWAVPIVFFFIILAFAENEKNFFAGLSLAVFVAIMYHSNFIVFTDPWTIVKYFSYYFTIGAVWSIAKWYFFIGNKAKDFGELKLRFIQKFNKKQNRANTADNDSKAEDFPLIEVDAKAEIPLDATPEFKAFVLANVGHSNLHDIDAKDATIAEIVIPAASKFKEKITTWILWWPTSAFWTILNDPLVKLANAIYDKFQGIYTRIANKAFAKFEV